MPSTPVSGSADNRYARHLRFRGDMRGSLSGTPAAMGPGVPDAIGPAWDEALTADRPAVLDIRRDPDVLPIPPHATFDQPVSTAKAVLHGDENVRGFVRQGAKDKFTQLRPGAKN
nr:hypothetical protein [Parafrankia discariae]